MNKLSGAFLKNKRNFLIFAFILIFAFARYLCYGFKYFPQLDDYIQYWAYLINEDIWGNVVVSQGLLCSRPLAVLGDVYVWGHLFDNMILGVLIISAMYALSALIFMKVFNKYFKTGFMFTVFYSLMPFFYEGAYWVSASTRIVVGLFFVSLAVLFLQKFIETDKKLYILPFWFFQLISISFYEQIFILSLVLNFGIIILNLKKKRKNALLILVLFANAAIYFAFTKFFSMSDSMLGTRIKIEYPALTMEYMEHLAGILNQLKISFLDVPLTITFKGFIRGLKIIVTDGLWIFAILSIVLAAVSYMLCKSEPAYNEKNQHKKLTVFAGIILAIMPIALFFIISNPYFCMRNILPSFIGIALILDMIFAILARHKKAVMCVVSSAIAILFFVSSVSETHDYKAVYDFDTKVASAAKDVVNTGEIQQSAAFIIPVLDREPINVRFHEHGSGVISSDWAFLGLLNYLNPYGLNHQAIPIEIESDNVLYSPWNKAQRNPLSYEKVYCWKDDISGFVEVHIDNLSDSNFSLVTTDGVCIATVETCYDTGYIYFK